SPATCRPTPDPVRRTADREGSMSTETTATVPRTFTRLDVRPVTAVIGAEIRGVDLRDPLDAETAGEIRSALHRWKVVFFRDQPITPEQHLAFGRAFGEITPAHPVVQAGGAHGHPEIFRLDLDRQRKTFAAGRSEASAIVSYDTTRSWHTDITFVPNP